MQLIRFFSISFVFNFACYKKKALTHLEELHNFCPQSSLSTFYTPEISIDLPFVDKEPHSETFSVLWVSNDAMSFEWNSIYDYDSLVDTLDNKRAIETTGSDLQIAFDSAVEGERVAEIIKTVYEAGYSNLWIVLYSAGTATFPTPPNVKHYQKMKEIAENTPSDMSQVILARQVTKDVGMCRPAINAFEAVAMAAPAMKCELLIRGMQYATPRCPFMNASKLVSGLQPMMEPDGDPVVHRLTLDPTADEISIQSSQSWEQLVPILIQQDSLWLPSIPKPKDAQDIP
jgi:biopolymer transport protein ExbD